ncbi:hypothetical protein TSTA_015500 [Talaromyces stipitatus ATCC 10500]|uniref:Uncharacterized protein n=1 Tax=Talaromyces stipitatus (strain ATCC 10500 / CBS 375.48 / QM 6759 / NRRL 1006) TaxID=441959 RepID=B8MHY4_TALSN|nr:uncharacterized protein TSTA_015500 [Talaromyces stipitatus ATCC 10500]EED16464.1 hypothetical protein TSTA_015500 [Talaromyces stipitatus ATCC 10500]
MSKKAKQATSGANMGENMFGPLLDQALHAAVDKAVKKALNEVLEKTVDQAVKKVVDEAARKVMQEAFKPSYARKLPRLPRSSDEVEEVEETGVTQDESLKTPAQSSIEDDDEDSCESISESEEPSKGSFRPGCEYHTAILIKVGYCALEVRKDHHLFVAEYYPYTESRFNH